MDFELTGRYDNRKLVIRSIKLKSGKRLMLTKTDGGYTCVIELKPFDDGEFYDVITGLISRRKSIENKLAKEKIRLLWQKPKQP
ncbi:MAG: hypothetical protein IJ207_03925 [Treponema sp.]|uniref:hypothetical protein n=1 Tax=Treponema sp. TaxID=166 RepID=UPI0025F87737|nr:hypothetical protein [Treponema sp.]MBQ9281329.1 hypothetical protein [Treponema sp.]